MLEEYLVQECDLVETIHNTYGDYVISSATTLNCRWRDIPTVTRAPHIEQSDADSMVWFAPDAGVVKGSILKFEGTYYEVQRIVTARRLGEAESQFLKCEVKTIMLGIS